MSLTEKEAIREWKSLQKLQPIQWMERIKSLPERAQGQIARMVWWDFWSNRVVSERWSEFDHWLQFDEREETDPVTKTTLIKCLKAVGYPKYRIDLRLMAFQ
jgi:hypothetical protein